MATNFPTSLDSLTNPASSDQLNVPSHSLQHANANDAIEALETKVGINNSGGTTSLDYRVKQLEITPPSTYTNEEAVDAVASALAAGTHSNITITYNDAGNSISISAAAGYTNEEAVDAVAAALTQSSGISIAYNDSANTITISVDSSVVLKTGATMTGALTLSGAPTTGLHAATKTYVDTATATVTSNSTTTYVPLSSVGMADGVASLNSSGVIPDAQIPAAIARDSEVSSAISTAVNNLINSAPGTLDTLGEIATALAADESAAASLTTLVNGKVSKAGGDIITSSLASTIGLIVKGAASQTANLQEWQDSAGTVNASITSLGRLSLGGAGLGSYTLTIKATDAIILYSPDNTSGIRSYTAYVRGNTGGNPMYFGSIGDAANGVAAITTTSGAGSTSITSFGVNGNIVTNIQSASAIGLIVKGAASQTANLQEWRDSAGTVMGRVDGQYGTIRSISGLDLTNTYTGSATITARVNYPNTTPIIIVGAASQTANLQEWQNSAGTVLSFIRSDGYARLDQGLQFGTMYSYAGTWSVDGGNSFKITQSSASHSPLIVKGAASQTANLQEWQNSAGTNLAYMSTNGHLVAQRVYAPDSLYVVATGGPGTVNIETYAAQGIGVIIKGKASQTANLQEWQDSSGSVLARVNANGTASFQGITTYGKTASPSAYDSVFFNLGVGASSDGVSWFRVKGGNAGDIVSVFDGVASQTGDLTQWRNSAGSVLAKVDSSGVVYPNSIVSTGGNANSFGGNTLAGVILSVHTNGATGQVIRGAGSQTLDLQQWQNSSGTVLAKVDSSGAMFTITPTDSTNTTQVATTAFVKTAINTSVQPGAVYQTSAPASPAVGQIWIDSDENVTTFDSNIFSRQSFIASASQTVFTSSVPFIEGYEQVYFNGLMLSRSADYTTSGSNTVTLSSGAAVNDIVEIVTITALNAYVASQPLSISANTNLAASKRYFVTSASALTLTLPTNPSLNDQIDVVDASGNALTYNITIARNGKLINGLAVNLIIDTSGSFISLLYTGSTYGWRAQ